MTKSNAAQEEVLSNFDDTALDQKKEEENRIIVHPKVFAELDSLRAIYEKLTASITKEMSKGRNFCIMASKTATRMEEEFENVNKEIKELLGSAKTYIAKIMKKKPLSRADKAMAQQLDALINQIFYTLVDNDDDDLSAELEDIFEHLRKAVEGDDDEESFKEEQERKGQEKFSEDAGFATENFNSNKPKNEELRSIFLQLSKKFHPDLATNEEERVRFTAIIKEVNTQYSNDNLSGLLALWNSETDDALPLMSANTIELEIARLQKEIDECNSFIKILRKQTRELRKSHPSPKSVDLIIKGKLSLEEFVKIERERMSPELDAIKKKTHLLKECSQEKISVEECFGRVALIMESLNEKNSDQDDFEDAILEQLGVLFGQPKAKPTKARAKTNRKSQKRKKK
jgi:hypothetical protein